MHGWDTSPKMLIGSYGTVQTQFAYLVLISMVPDDHIEFQTLANVLFPIIHTTTMNPFET